MLANRAAWLETRGKIAIRFRSSLYRRLPAKMCPVTFGDTGFWCELSKRLLGRCQVATNKNQHYVPKAHLKPFSLDSQGRAISLYNIDRRASVRNAPVRNQCSGDYFYGREKALDDAIQAVESPYLPVVQALSGGEALDDHTTTVLRRFMYLQYLRTESACQAAAQMMTAFTDVPGSDLPKPHFGELMKEAVQTAMGHFFEAMQIVDDLKLCIVRNRSDVPFVTSDNPSVLTNRLHTQRRVGAGASFGVKSAGALFLMPLTPSLSSVLYDGSVYSVPHRARIVELQKESDAAMLNQHQYLRCMANIYFREWENEPGVRAAADSAMTSRPEASHTVRHAVLEASDEHGERYVVKQIEDIRDGRKWLVHVIPNQPDPGGWPSIIRFRPDGHAWSNGTGAGTTRRYCIDQGFVTGAGYRKIRI